METRTAGLVLDERIAHLHAQPRLRVWSLIISFFGDAVVPRGGSAGLTVIQALMDRLKVGPGAVRTAMSRLAAEGWVARERNGRLSTYRLGGGGRHAFDAATRRIYASGPPHWAGGWTVAIAPLGALQEQGERMAAAGFISVGERVFVRADTETTGDSSLIDKDMLVISGEADALPADLHALWQLDPLIAAYDEFCADWGAMANALAADMLTGLDAMAARTLLVHDWRRIALRDPGLPMLLLPDRWPGEKARMLARAIYAPLVNPSETWLDAAGLPPQRDPLVFAQRFGIQPKISAKID